MPKKQKIRLILSLLAAAFALVAVFMIFVNPAMRVFDDFGVHKIDAKQIYWGVGEYKGNLVSVILGFFLMLVVCGLSIAGGFSSGKGFTVATIVLGCVAILFIALTSVFFASINNIEAEYLHHYHLGLGPILAIIYGSCTVVLSIIKLILCKFVNDKAPASPKEA